MEPPVHRIAGYIIAAVVILAGCSPERPGVNVVIQNPPRFRDWDVVADELHNSNTDLIFWKGMYYLVHASSSAHIGTAKAVLIVRTSNDAHAWTPAAVLQFEDQDMRDPKFAVVGNRLFLYALLNTALAPEPYTTVVSVSEDGSSWSPFREVRPGGWLLWRPKWAPDSMMYVCAYWHGHGKSILLQSRDGFCWKYISTVYEGDTNDETDIVVLPDRRLLVTARLEILESFVGNPRGQTLIAVASPPYKTWEIHRSYTTRLDGPNLFAYAGHVFAVGRFQPVTCWPFANQGSLLAGKRTALFVLADNDLVHILDLPSGGDTGYAGVVIAGDSLIISYYTSPPSSDPIWLRGMMNPTDIRMAAMSLDALDKCAGSIESSLGPPLGGQRDSAYPTGLDFALSPQ